MPLLRVISSAYLWGDGKVNLTEERSLSAVINNSREGWADDNINRKLPDKVAPRERATDSVVFPHLV